MDLNFHHTYDGSAERVVDLMRTKEFVEDVARHGGAESYDVSIDGEVARLNMALASPPNIAKVVGARVQLTQTMSWGAPDAQGNRPGAIQVEVSGMPVQVNASSTLRPTGAESSEADFQGTLNVRIPLLGRTIEAQIAPMIADAFAGIERRANDWLSRG